MTTRIEGIVDRLSEADDYNSISWILEAPVENIALAVVDNTMRENVAFQTDAGLKCTVTRTADANACAWCQGLDGTFVYPDVPDDLWHRHENCRCIIEYENEKTGTHTWHGAGQGKAWKTINPATLANRQAFQGVATSPKTINTNDVVNALAKRGVMYNNVAKMERALTVDEIVAKIGGQDRTGGSCASLVHTFIGNKKGYDVRDFRGGVSRSYFSIRENSKKIYEEVGATMKIVTKENDFTASHELLKSMEEGKIYALHTGHHASIVRKTEGGFEYLELQGSEDVNGWTAFSGSNKLGTDDTLKDRFGCQRTHTTYGSHYERENLLTEVDTFPEDSEAYREILGYLNTKEGDELKGVGGGIK